MIPTGSSSVLRKSKVNSPPSEVACCIWTCWGIASTGLWSVQKEESNAGEFWHPLLTCPGISLYTIYPAWVAAHTARWFFIFPSRIIASVQPGFSHLCSGWFRILNNYYIFMMLMHAATGWHVIFHTIVLSCLYIISSTCIVVTCMSLHECSTINRHYPGEYLHGFVV